MCMGLGSNRQSRVFPYPKEHVWGALHQACQVNGWEINKSDEIAGALETKSDRSVLCPFGVNIRVALAVDPEGTEVWVDAKSKGQLIDYGQSGREVNKLLTVLSSVLGQPANHVPVNASGNNRCLKCGEKLSLTAKFCGGCGLALSAPANAMPTTKEVLQITCPDCGTPQKDGAKFCGKCGTKTAGCKT